MKWNRGEIGFISWLILIVSPQGESIDQSITGFIKFIVRVENIKNICIGKCGTCRTNYNYNSSVPRGTLPPNII